MNSKLYLLLLFAVTSLMGEQNQSVHEKPTIEQLLNTDKVIISFECTRDLDKQNVDMEHWLTIAVALNDLIDKCYAYENDDELFEEVFQTIRLIRNEQHTHPNTGIHGRLYVAGETSKQEENISK